MLFHLPRLITVGVDIAAWLAIHIGVSYLATRTPLSSFNPDSWFFRRRRWERNGRLYSRFFVVKRWKKRLPDGAAAFKEGFEKRHLRDTSEEYFADFIRETCRAELTHWMVLLFGPVFLIWNIWWVGVIMVAYASAVNLPCIITQRYNRIRLRRMVGR